MRKTTCALAVSTSQGPIYACNKPPQFFFPGMHFVADPARVSSIHGVREVPAVSASIYHVLSDVRMRNSKMARLANEQIIAINGVEVQLGIQIPRHSNRGLVKGTTARLLQQGRKIRCVCCRDVHSPTHDPCLLCVV